MAIWSTEKVQPRRDQSPAASCRWDGCVEFPLLVPERQLMALELVANDTGWTIARIIRRIVECYLARHSRDTRQDFDHLALESASKDLSLITVRFLLPRLRLVEIAGDALRRNTTPEKLIRRVIWHSLIVNDYLLGMLRRTASSS